MTAGYETKGTLQGAASTLTLTVQARDEPLVPVLVAMAALLAAVLLAWLVAVPLPKIVAWGLVKYYGQFDKGVSGLGTWATAAKGRLSTTDRVARMRWARTLGAPQVRAARLRLRDGLDQWTDIPPCPLRTSAEVEAGRADVTADDLLTPGGDKASGGADELYSLLERAHSAVIEFTQVSDFLLPQVPDELQPAAARSSPCLSGGWRCCRR